MEDDEKEFRRLEYDQRERFHNDQRTIVRRTTFLTIGSLLISAAALSVTFMSQTRQSRDAAQQFQDSARRDQFGQIISGLSSSSVAVQDSSMRRLIAFVGNRNNYDSKAEQGRAVANAIHTLTAFIVDESVSDSRPGLAHYQDPQPIIVPRAMTHLRLLASRRLGAVVVDVGGADLHGASLPDFRPVLNIRLTGADLRRANLSDLDLTAGDEPSMVNSAFLTCANLTGARLGEAYVGGTDLTGADLTDADLSQVTGLDRRKLHGTRITEGTRLPEGIDLPSRDGWIGTERCYTLVNKMTGMRGAQGYADFLPCPITLAAARAMDIEPAWQGELTDLVDACRLRKPSLRTLSETPRRP